MEEIKADVTGRFGKAAAATQPLTSHPDGGCAAGERLAHRDSPSVELVDLTRSIRNRMPHSGTQPVPMIWPSSTHAESASARGGGFSTGSMAMLLSDHSGTHVDAWNHLDPGPDAADIAAMPLTDFVIPAAGAIDVSGLGPDEIIPVSVLLAAFDALAEQVEAVIIRTGAVPEPPPTSEIYLKGFPGLDAAGVHALADRGARLIGVDTRSLDTAASESGDDYLPAHRACLRRRVVALENLVIPAELCGQVFELLVLPLKILTGTGSPVRAVARLPLRPTPLSSRK